MAASCETYAFSERPPSRASTSRPADAHAVLSPVLEGFTATPEMTEIVEAQALIERLAWGPSSVKRILRSKLNDGVDGTAGGVFRSVLRSNPRMVMRRNVGFGGKRKGARRSRCHLGRTPTTLRSRSPPFIAPSSTKSRVPISREA
jgi:hypothetical protein